MNALHFAAANCSLAMVTYLLCECENGISVESLDAARLSTRVSLLRRFVPASVQHNSRTAPHYHLWRAQKDDSLHFSRLQANRTPLDFAASRNLPECAALLLNYGAVLNAPTPCALSFRFDDAETITTIAHPCLLPSENVSRRHNNSADSLHLIVIQGSAERTCHPSL